MPGVRPDDIARRVVLHHHIEPPSAGGLTHPHPQLPGGGPDQLGEVSSGRVPGLGLIPAATLVHSWSQIRSELVLRPALLCHKNTYKGTQSPLLGGFLALCCVFMA